MMNSEDWRERAEKAEAELRRLNDASVVAVKREELGKILALLGLSNDHAHGYDCRGFDSGDELDPKGHCECGLVPSSEAASMLEAILRAGP